MSGKAILIPGCDFASANLGVVTEQSSVPVPVSSISIQQSGSYSGQAIQLSVAYQPSNTTQTGITWSITSGSEYATISNSGLLTIKTNANNSAVTVKATSTANSSVFASANLTITYEAAQTYQVTQSLNNVTSSNSANTVLSGAAFSTTLTPDSNYEIGDVRVTMAGVNITQNCTIVKSSNSLYATPTWTITTPNVSGALEITNEAHKAYLFGASDLLFGNIASTVKTAQAKTFVHLNTIIPVSQGQVIRLYYPETLDSNLVTVMDDAATNTWHGVRWHHKFVETNTTTWSNFTSSSKDMTPYLSDDFANFLYWGQSASDTQSGVVDSLRPYTIGSNAAGIYVQLGIMTRESGGSAADAQLTSATVSYGNVLTSKTLNTYGNIFANHGNPCLKLTIDESTLSGGYIGGTPSSPIS